MKSKNKQKGFRGILSSLDTLVGAAAFLTFFAIFVGQVSNLYGGINHSAYSALSSISINARIQEAVEAIRETDANESVANLILNNYLSNLNYTFSMLPLPKNLSYNVLRLVVVKGKIYYIGALK